jgi:hypothetical protein
MGCPKVGLPPNSSPSALHGESFDPRVGAFRVRWSSGPWDSDAVPDEGWRSMARVRNFFNGCLVSLVFFLVFTPWLLFLEERTVAAIM